MALVRTLIDLGVSQRVGLVPTAVGALLSQCLSGLNKHALLDGLRLMVIKCLAQEQEGSI